MAKFLQRPLPCWKIHFCAELNKTALADWEILTAILGAINHKWMWWPTFFFCHHCTVNICHRDPFSSSFIWFYWQTYRISWLKCLASCLGFIVGVCTCVYKVTFPCVLQRVTDHFSNVCYLHLPANAMQAHTAVLKLQFLLLQMNTIRIQTVLHKNDQNSHFLTWFHWLTALCVPHYTHREWWHSALSPRPLVCFSCNPPNSPDSAAWTWWSLRGQDRASGWTPVTLTRSVDRIEVKTQLPERQLHGTLHAWRRSLICERSHGASVHPTTTSSTWNKWRSCCRINLHLSMNCRCICASLSEIWRCGKKTPWHRRDQSIGSYCWGSREQLLGLLSTGCEVQEMEEQPTTQETAEEAEIAYMAAAKWSGSLLIKWQHYGRWKRATIYVLIFNF